MKTLRNKTKLPIEVGSSVLENRRVNVVEFIMDLKLLKLYIVRVYHVETGDTLLTFE